MTFALATSQTAPFVKPPTLGGSQGSISALAREGVRNLLDCIPHPSASRGDEDRPSLRAIFSQAGDLEEQLHEARRQAKTEILKLAPRISDEWLRNLRWQLDEILNPEAWDDDDKVLSVDSWQSFLRGLFIIRPRRLPGIGLSRDGNIVASWSRTTEHLDIEFKPHDQARWVLAAEIDGQVERASGRTSAFRLTEVLAPYQPERWFVA